MTAERMIELLKIEKECVERGNRCERDCARCELVQDDVELKEMYDDAIATVERDIPMEPVLNEKHLYVSDTFRCGRCGSFVLFHAGYCHICAQAVKWE